jgi:hypothetical protein
MKKPIVARELTRPSINREWTRINANIFFRFAFIGIHWRFFSLLLRGGVDRRRFRILLFWLMGSTQRQKFLASCDLAGCGFIGLFDVFHREELRSARRFMRLATKPLPAGFRRQTFAPLVDRPRQTQ